MMDKIKDIYANISQLSISEEHIHKLIGGLPNDLVAGPNEIFLRQYAASISPPITHLLRESLESTQAI